MAVSDESRASLACATPKAGWAHLRISGDLDYCSTLTVQRRIAEQVPRECGQVVVDLSDLGFIDSSGIRVLLQFVARGGEGRRVVFVYPRSLLARRALEVVGLPQVVPVVETLSDACSISAVE
jgi:anti-anti-sigma factor